MFLLPSCFIQSLLVSRLMCFSILKLSSNIEDEQHALLSCMKGIWECLGDSKVNHQSNLAFPFDYEGSERVNMLSI